MCRVGVCPGVCPGECRGECLKGECPGECRKGDAVKARMDTATALP